MKFYLTTPIYYVNDKPHIGSAYTTVAADILARFHRLAGDDTFMLTGTAEHGSKIAASAEKAGIDPQKFADQVSAQFKEAWAKLDISYDHFVRTTDPEHVQAVNVFFNKLKDSGKIYEGDYEGLYCIACEQFKKPDELVDGLCALHGTKPELVKERNWFFKLSDYQEILLDLIENDDIVIAPSERRNEIISFIKQGLEDITISRRTAKFALPLPWDDSQSIYVWLDELFNYCSAVGYASDPEQFKRYWPADLHLVGKDIIKFHCIIWPALLLAIGEQPPRKIFAHGFFTVNGQKMSKSLGNVIDPVEVIEKFGSDAVRYFLMREVPFGQDGDVSVEKLQGRYESDLANGLGNLVSRLTNMIEKYFAGQVPEVLHPQNKLEEVDELVASCKFHEALIKIWEAVAWANEYIDKSKPWDLAKEGGDQEKLRQVVSELAAQVHMIGHKLAPFMPKTAERIRSAFEGGQIVKINDLFPRVG